MSQLEELLRQSSLSYGHIQLFRGKDGWQASVCHYPPAAEKGPGATVDSKPCSDPVEAFTKVLMEDARRTADLGRRYRNAMDEAPRQIDLEEAIAAADQPAFARPSDPSLESFEDILG